MCVTSLHVLNVNTAFTHLGNIWAQVEAEAIPLAPIAVVLLLWLVWGLSPPPLPHHPLDRCTVGLWSITGNLETIAYVMCLFQS